MPVNLLYINLDNPIQIKEQMLMEHVTADYLPEELQQVYFFWKKNSSEGGLTSYRICCGRCCENWHLILLYRTINEQEIIERFLQFRW